MKASAETKAFRLRHLSRVAPDLMGKLRLKTLSNADEIPRIEIIHVLLPPNTRHALIRHRRTKEWFIVTKGRGTGTVGGKKIVFRPGSIVYMPPGVSHQMSTSKSPMEALAVFSPPLRLGEPRCDVEAAD